MSQKLSIVNEMRCLDNKDRNFYDSLTDDGFIALQLHSIGKNKNKANKKIRWKNFSLKSF